MPRLADFDYKLPQELIAQYPAETRGNDRLLVLDRKKKTFEEKAFSDITGYFREGDLLVLNDTRVIPARLYGKRKTGGKVEMFILDKSGSPAEALVRPSARIKEGETVELESGDRARLLGRAGIGRFVEFERPLGDILEKCGHVPLPPYISRPDEEGDRVRYQTVYARSDGATASPTAGLHFTEEVFKELEKKNVNISFITLHVSYGTFAPVKDENIKKHRMHREYFEIPEGTARLVNEAKKRGKKVFCTGTTSARALESRAKHAGGGMAAAFKGSTELFIFPPYRFKVVDALITNFHLPRSTLLLLVSAFAGRDFILDAYEYAVKNRFRFFSYGDCMLII